MRKEEFPASLTVSWEKLYKGFMANVCDIDCGKLCAPANGGIPACCKNEDCSPVLYTDELKWVKKRTDLWKKRKAKSAEEKKE